MDKETLELKECVTPSCEEEHETEIESYTESTLPKLNTEIGNIYYSYDEEKDAFHTLRIMKIQNQETVSCMMDNNPSDIRKISIKDIREKRENNELHLLLSNAIMTISKVVIAFDETTGEPRYDVVIMIYKRDSIETTFGEPDVLARQAISDIFYEPFCNQNQNPYVGISVTKQTCPAGYTIGELGICDQQLDYMIINLYRTDTMDTILKLCNSKKWDKVFETIYLSRINYKRRTLPLFEEPKIGEVDGYCKSLAIFFKSNNFMYDFYNVLGIMPVTFEIISSTDPDKILPLSYDQKEILQDLYEINMEKTMVMKYDFTIDLDLIKMPYLLVMDITDTLYLIGFTRSKEEYVKSISTIGNDMKQVRDKMGNSVQYNNYKYSK